MKEQEIITRGSKEMWGNLSIGARVVAGFVEKPWKSVKESIFQLAGRKIHAMYRRPMQRRFV